MLFVEVRAGDGAGLDCIISTVVAYILPSSILERAKYQEHLVALGSWVLVVGGTVMFA